MVDGGVVVVDDCGVLGIMACGRSLSSTSSSSSGQLCCVADVMDSVSLGVKDISSMVGNFCDMDDDDDDDWWTFTVS